MRRVHVRRVCEVGTCTERAGVRETREGRRRRGGGRRRSCGLAGLPESGRVGEECSCQNACFDLISPISTLRAAFSPSMKSLLPDGLLDKDGPRRQAQAWLPVGKSIHERKRISRGIPPDVCHAHKANAKVTSINGKMMFWAQKNEA